VGYELDEESGWAVSREQLNANLEEARANELNVKAMVIINPGNPTGQVLSREDLATICKFCADEGIVLLADEVYQRNVYEGEFISAKKVAMETPGCEHLELVSFHSTSKGLIGECGRRGGVSRLRHWSPCVFGLVHFSRRTFRFVSSTWNYTTSIHTYSLRSTNLLPVACALVSVGRS